MDPRSSPAQVREMLLQGTDKIGAATPRGTPANDKAVEWGVFSRREFRRAFWDFGISGSSMAVNLGLSYFVNLGTIMYMNYYSKTSDIAVIGVTNVWMCLLCIFPTSGICAYLGSVMSEAVRRKNYDMAGILWQRNLTAISLVVLLYIFITLIAFKKVMLTIGILPELIDASLTFTKLNFGWIYLFAVYTSLATYLNAFGVFKRVFYVEGANFILFVVYLELFVKASGLGLAGVTASKTLMVLGQVLGILYLIKFKGVGTEAWIDWSPATLTHGLVGYLQESLGNGLAYFIEATGMELIILMANWQGAVASVAAATVVYNIAEVLFVVATGYSMTMTATIESELVNGTKRRAQLYVFTGVIVTCLLSVIEIILLIFFRIFLVDYFVSGDKKTAELYQKIIIVYFLMNLIDNLLATMSGVLKAIGFKTFYLKVLTLGTFILGAPLGYFFGFKQKFGDIGIWLGFVIGEGIATLILVWTVFRRIDWDADFEAARNELQAPPPLSFELNENRA